MHFLVAKLTPDKPRNTRTTNLITIINIKNGIPYLCLSKVISELVRFPEEGRAEYLVSLEGLANMARTPHLPHPHPLVSVNYHA